MCRFVLCCSSAPTSYVENVAVHVSNDVHTVEPRRQGLARVPCIGSGVVHENAVVRARLRAFAANHPEKAAEPHRGGASTWLREGLDTAAVCRRLPHVGQRVVNLHNVKGEAVAASPICTAAKHI